MNAVSNLSRGHLQSSSFHRRDRSPRVGANGAADGPFADAIAAIPPWYYWLTAAGTVVGVYHGYKRNNSVGWAIGWGLLGGIFPYFVIPIAFAQGIDKKKGS